MSELTKTSGTTYKQTIFKSVLKYIIAFVLLTALEFSLLTVAALIPRTSIQKNVTDSASYYMQSEVFYNINQGDRASRIDHYADSILLNILYNYDNKRPFSSSMKSSYYYSDLQNENENLMDTVSLGKPANYDYFRYWHGSAIIIRPLLTLLSVRGIYIALAVILGILAIALGYLIFRCVNHGAAISFVISMIAVSCWFIPFSFEYIWCFMIMLISCIALLLIYRRNRFAPVIFFFVTGNITAYFDFLSTETITLLMPLSLLVILRCESHTEYNAKDNLLFVLKNCMLWLAGYASSWIAKWTIASFVLKKNAFAAAADSASVRMTGDTSGIKGPAMAINGLIRNISCLFPFNLIPAHAFAWFVLFILITTGLYFLFRKSSKKKGAALPLTLLLFVPYIRYVFLANHSFLHYFFTYRAQAASVFCLCMILYYNIDWKLVKKKLHRA